MNKVYLLDTNIVSEFSKKRPNESVLALYEARKGLCAISAVTWQELVCGVSRMPEGNRKDSIADFTENLKENIEIIPYDEFSADICGQLSGTCAKAGKNLSCCDTQIAATAIANGMILVTRNTADFAEAAERSFLRLENWFTA